MLTFALRRAVQAVPLLLLISALVFALIHAVPGGPLAIFLENPNVRPQDIERLQRALGLDRPLAEQYVNWLAAFARGDWGYSLSDGRAVAERIGERVPATLQLMGAALFVALIASVPAAIAAAVRNGRLFDRAATAISLAGISLPVFWFGLVVQLVFAVALRWLPSSGRSSIGGSGTLDVLRHLLLPAVVLATVHAAAWSRFLRASLLQSLRERYVVAARGKGMPRHIVIWRHALANALLPFTTVVMLDAALMVSGAVVTESVFAWPGMGGLFTEALARRDYSVLMACLMLTSMAVVVLNFAADLTYRVVDPRLRA